jgi:hypothetical protein
LREQGTYKDVSGPLSEDATAPRDWAFEKLGRLTLQVGRAASARRSEALSLSGAFASVCACVRRRRLRLLLAMSVHIFISERRGSLNGSPQRSKQAKGKRSE